jgi:hypothetical protein
VLAANEKDVASARAAGISAALLDRLLLDPLRIRKIIQSLREVLALADPLSEVRELGVRPNGLRVAKRRFRSAFSPSFTRRDPTLRWKQRRWRSRAAMRSSCAVRR